MIQLTKITTVIKDKVTSLYRDHKRVDMSVDSILEGQSGGNICIYVDDPTNPRVVQFIQGTFTSFAGDAESDTAQEMVTHLPERCWIQPCSDEWYSLIKRVHGNKLIHSTRYSFASDHIESAHLEELIEQNPYADCLKPIDLATAHTMIRDDLNKYHFMNYGSPEAFINQGFGYCVEVDGRVVAACSSGLVCSKGVEICIITQPDYRERDLATLVAAKFILHCKENNLEPHWDAANPKSVGLAKKLGYTYIESYEVIALPREE